MTRTGTVEITMVAYLIVSAYFRGLSYARPVRNVIRGVIEQNLAQDELQRIQHNNANDRQGQRKHDVEQQRQMVSSVDLGRLLKLSGERQKDGTQNNQMKRIDCKRKEQFIGELKALCF